MPKSGNASAPPPRPSLHGRGEGDEPEHPAENHDDGGRGIVHVDTGDTDDIGDPQHDADDIAGGVDGSAVMVSSWVSDSFPA